MPAGLHSQTPPESQRDGYMKPRRRSSFSAPLMFAVVVVAMIFVMSVFFRISDIEIVGNTHYTDEEIIRAIAMEEGDNLFFFDHFSTMARVFSKLPYIDQVVSVERRLPNKIVITVEESTALAYLELGDEQWTMDRNCKILGKAAEGETESLIPVVGIKPGTLLIGEPLQTEDGDEEILDYLRQVLYQLEERGLYDQTSRVDFSDPKSPEFDYGGKYTVVLGDSNDLERKFGMFVNVLGKLKPGDIGVIDVSNGINAHFSPN